MMIRKALAIFGIVYFLGGAFTFGIQTQMPVTFGLAVLRSFIWPLWITTGIPKGETCCNANDLDISG